MSSISSFTEALNSLLFTKLLGQLMSQQIQLKCLNESNKALSIFSAKNWLFLTSLREPGRLTSCLACLYESLTELNVGVEYWCHGRPFRPTYFHLPNQLRSTGSCWLCVLDPSPCPDAAAVKVLAADWPHHVSVDRLGKEQVCMAYTWGAHCHIL